MSESTIEDLYRGSGAVRPHFPDAETAKTHRAPFIDFVVRTAASKGGSLLEVGCGDGWSSWLLSEAGFDVTGVDLHRDDFAPVAHARLKFQSASVLDLPFENESFDVVTAYQMLEHTLDPERALREMARVLKPGGVLSIVGPNLLSPLVSINALTRFVWRNRPVSTIFKRRPGMPKHPFGNTLPEAALTMIRNWAAIARKFARRRAEFTMREPDLVPPFHADNDASYLCNSIDLMKFLLGIGFEIIRLDAFGRPRGTWILLGGTWFAARKKPERVR